VGVAVDDGRVGAVAVCRSSEEILNTQESWKAAMMTKGWHV